MPRSGLGYCDTRGGCGLEKLESERPLREAPGGAEVSEGRSAIVARRLPENPIIRHTVDARLREEASRYGHVNVNGPSLIRVPPYLLYSAAGEQAIAIARLRRRAPAD